MTRIAVTIVSGKSRSACASRPQRGRPLLERTDALRTALEQLSAYRGAESSSLHVSGLDSPVQATARREDAWDQT